MLQQVQLTLFDKLNGCKMNIECFQTDKDETESLRSIWVIVYNPKRDALKTEYADRERYPNLEDNGFLIAQFYEEDDSVTLYRKFNLVIDWLK